MTMMMIMMTTTMTVQSCEDFQDNSPNIKISCFCVDFPNLRNVQSSITELKSAKRWFIWISNNYSKYLIISVYLLGGLHLIWTSMWVMDCIRQWSMILKYFYNIIFSCSSCPVETSPDYVTELEEEVRVGDKNISKIFQTLKFNLPHWTRMFTPEVRSIIGEN